MKTKLTTILISFVFVLFSFPSLSFQSAEEQTATDGNVEKSTAYGKKSVGQLKREITKTTKSFFKDYNKLNQEKQFAVICKREKLKGSGIKTTICEPRFVKTKRSDMIANQLISNSDVGAMAGAVSRKKPTNPGAAPVLDFSRLSLLSGAGKAGISQNKEFNEHVQKLMQENPQLIKDYTAILELQAEYAFKRANK